MAGTNEVDFRHLKHGSSFLGAVGVRILGFLESALKLSPPTSPEREAEHFVDNLVKFSSVEKSGLQPEDFVWQFWDVLIGIASQVPPCSPEQDVLVETVSLLKAIGEGDKPENQIWKDLPDFSVAVRESWNRSPMVKDENGDKDFHTFTEPEWLNLNSFMARIHGNQTGWGKFPIWELRDGLESPLSLKNDKPTPNTRVRVAIEWILRSSCRLLLDSLMHNYSDYPEGPDTGHPYCGGPLYSGMSGYSLERWCFWKRRLAEIKTEVSQDLHSMIDKAMKAMLRAEKKLGKQLESSADLIDSEVELAIGQEPGAGSVCGSNSPKSEDHVKVDNTIDKCDLSKGAILEEKGCAGCDNTLE
ncbi:hypothetical protein F4814DRAFT_423062 [Daldinia grandis]|nr:hypothetical protein F4814DRAFT_423062 [Daldinia grandis]